MNCRVSRVGGMLLFLVVWSASSARGERWLDIPAKALNQCQHLMAVLSQGRLPTNWKHLYGSETIVEQELSRVLREEPLGEMVWTESEGYRLGALPDSDNVLVYRPGSNKPIGFWSSEGFLIRDKPGAKYHYAFLSEDKSIPPMPTSQYERRIFYEAGRPFDWRVVPMLLPEKHHLKIPRVRGVYRPDNSYSQGYLSMLDSEFSSDMEVLVVGSGVGHDAAVIALRAKAKVDAIDVDIFAVANSRATARVMGVANRVNVWRSDLFKNVEKKYDRIWTFPPTPSSKEFLGPEAMYDRGKQVYQRLLREVPQYLKPGGSLLLVSGLEPQGVQALLPADSPLVLTSADVFFPYGDLFRIYRLFLPREPGEVGGKRGESLATPVPE